MKTYPSIPREIINLPIIAFDKLDGSNIRAKWSLKKGFYTFGTRTQLLHPEDPTFGGVPNLIASKYSDSLARIFTTQRVKRAVAFFEFHGPMTFAGQHDPNDVHTVTLLDVAVDNRGLLEPQAFLRWFENVQVPAVLYRGVADDAFVDRVRRGELPGVSGEGVVCKGRYAAPGLPLMFKIKTHAWIDRLRAKYSNDENAFRALL